jgi:hypothetical protein
MDLFMIDSEGQLEGYNPMKKLVLKTDMRPGRRIHGAFSDHQGTTTGSSPRRPSQL